MEPLPPSYTSRPQLPSTTPSNNTNEPPPSNRSETEYPPLPYTPRLQTSAHYALLQEQSYWVLERRNDMDQSSHFEEQEQIIPPPPAQRQLASPFTSFQHGLATQQVPPTPMGQPEERNSHLLVQQYQPEIPTLQPQDFTTYMEMNGPPTSYEEFHRLANEYEAHTTHLAQTQGQNQNQEDASIRSNDNSNDSNNYLSIETPSQNTLTSNNTEPELRDLNNFSNFSSFLEWETELQRQTDLATRNQGLNYEELNRTFNNHAPRGTGRQNTSTRANQVLDSSNLNTTINSFNSLIKSSIPGQIISIPIANEVAASGNSIATARETAPIQNYSTSSSNDEELRSNTRRNFIERYVRQLRVLAGRRNAVRYEEWVLRERAERIADRIGFHLDDDDDEDGDGDDDEDDDGDGGIKERVRVCK